MEQTPKTKLTSKVVKCIFKKEFYNEDLKKTFYYHELTLDNGKKYDCATIEKYAAKISEGKIITYQIKDDGTTIKVDTPKGEVKSNSKAPSRASGKSSTNPSQKVGPKAPRPNKQDAYLGFSWAYAKDLVIAGKTKPTDLVALNKIARFIYENIGELLENNEKNISES